ncbi:hypothetical protein GGQ80_003503 [Sphingomonas jinjuensis]|uniref:Peptidase M61 catalytic domain-containing protein n=1 Tax=Sphingomonas jinjuensis TaxID=535907 RepID=A0A840FNW6_9SPHN|nr:hypothetical protein [Sphingomonas jinjuensis]MBB4155578.1 hypothetical protein [Sphingomonas jinjuensis]
MVRASLVAAAALIVAPSASAQMAVVTLKPIVATGAVSAIDVELVLPKGPDRLTLWAPIVYPGSPGVADRLSAITATDATGTVSLATRDDPPVPGGFPYMRHWAAERSVVYPFRLRFRMAVQPPGGANGPPFGLRAVGGGVVGAGSTLLMFPDDSTVAETRVRWDLTALPVGSIASTSLGDGTSFIVKGPPEALQGAWILAGPAGRYPPVGAAGGFSATWLGRPTFEAPAEMAYTARGHDYLARYFPHLKPTPPYRVFLQFREQPPFGGATALTQSFMLARGPLAPSETAVAPRSTLFHEMIHQWVGNIQEPNGIASWFTEGLTNYYQDLLMLRGGFVTPAAYQAAINTLAEEYYTSKARNWSAAQITKVGFGDEEVRHTPYRRGALYFYDLDARIRAASGGKRTLDSVLFPMFLAREKGQSFDNARWIAMVTAELGPGEKTRFERLIIDGIDTLAPQSDAFGPCFTRQPATYAGNVPGYRWTRVVDVPDSRCAR